MTVIRHGQHLEWPGTQKLPENREVRWHEHATGTLITNLGFLEFRREHD